MDGSHRLEEALKALRRGWALTPLDGKRPLLKAWQRQPKPTEDDIRRWVAEGHNLGLRTGVISGVIAVDDDTEDGSGARALGLPPTITVITGSGKAHYYFKAGDTPIGNSASKLHPRVDVRGQGGQVVFVGSVHPTTGEPYLWLPGHSPEEIELAELPPHLLELLLGGEPPANCHGVQGATAACSTAALAPPSEQHPYAKGALKKSVARVAMATDGERNNTLNKESFNLGKFVGAGLLDQSTVESKLMTAAVAVGLSEREARATIASGLGAALARPVDVRTLLEKKQVRNKRRQRPPSESEQDSASELQLPPEEPARMEIYVQGGSLPEQVDMAEAVLLSNGGLGIYQRGDILVRTHRTDVDGPDACAIRRPKGALVIRPADPPYLVDLLTRHATWLKFDKRSSEWVPIDCPEKVAVTYLSRAGGWRVPLLRGVIEAPTIRPDGSVLSVDGYDRATGLLFDSGGVAFGPFLPRPTIDDARKALNDLLFILKDFPFRAPCDRATALAAILTALVRRSIRSSPLFAFRAPVMGSGKSLLADIIALLATGRGASMIAQGKDEDEIRKRILAILIQGDAIACIDNVTHSLESAALCSVLTQEYYQDRILGYSQMVRVPTSLTWMATGNNMVFEGDMIARVLPCDLEPGCEHPETRKFGLDLRLYVPEHRARLVTSALTVILAYRHAGCPDQGLPVYGRFEEWSEWVRSALVWCGEEDPCAGRLRLEDVDPVSRRLRAVLQAWFGCFGSSPVTAAEAIRQGDSDLQHALLEVASERGGQLDTRKLGNWLHAHQRRIDLGFRLERAGERSGSALWMVSKVGSPAAAGGPMGSVGPLNPTCEKTQANTGVGAADLPQVPQVPRQAEAPPSGAPENGLREGFDDEGVL